MEKTFALEILTPNRTVFTGPVTSLVAPGSQGYLGVLANHAPLLTTLKKGKVILRDSTGLSTTFLSTAGGLLHVHQNRVILLADEITG